MTPNLRFNKKLTKKLLAASPKEEDRSTLLHIDWHLENDTNKIFGLQYTGLFKTTTFFLQKDKEKDVYRLVACDKNPLCGFFIIDDIDRFLEVVGIQVLDLIEPEEIINSLKATIVCPNTGIIVVDDDNKVFVYEHCNY